jgi:alpha-galactosidase
VLLTKPLSILVGSTVALAALGAPPGSGASDWTTSSGSAKARSLEFLRWAPTPPMGWNSWDSFGTTLTEAQARQQADFMAEHLLPHGWRLLTVDIQWYEPGASGHAYRPDAPLVMDRWGRLLPAPNRFPSAVDGAGFAPLAAYVHERGLQLGIHLMRGIPRRAVAQNLPVKGTSVSAADIANRNDVCPWNPDMYGVDMSKPGAQAYYDSVFELIASWGVDFVKVDDISRPYHDHEPEIEAIRRAIDRTGRRIVLSLSPGETVLSAAQHVRAHANMWRISDDFWDTWPALLEQFDRLERWNPHRRAGNWPDADMLPLGVLDLGRRRTRFTPDEQRTLMTLWSIARSPLVYGGDMTKTDAATLALLTNDEVIAVDQHSEENQPLFQREGLVAWTAGVPGSRDLYLALFNTRDRFPVDLRTPAFVSTLVTRDSAGHGVEVDVDVRGGSRLALVAEGGDDGTGWDHALWAEPRLTMVDGATLRLTDERWTEASAGWGEVSTEEAPSGGQMTVLGRPVPYGISAHARSVVVYALPEGSERFRAFAAIDDGALTQPTGASVRFSVHVLPPPTDADPAGVPVRVSLSELGVSGPCRVRDLWRRADLGTVREELAPVVAWHGAALYRLSPES